jgi:hypothetical protein
MFTLAAPAGKLLHRHYMPVSYEERIHRERGSFELVDASMDSLRT